MASCPCTEMDDILIFDGLTDSERSSAHSHLPISARSRNARTHPMPLLCLHLLPSTAVPHRNAPSTVLTLYWLHGGLGADSRNETMARRYTGIRATGAGLEPRHSSRARLQRHSGSVRNCELVRQPEGAAAPQPLYSPRDAPTPVLCLIPKFSGLVSSRQGSGGAS